MSWKSNRLRVLRAERRITQIKLAKRVGMSQGKYCRIERAEHTPTPEEVAKFARVLKVDESVVRGEASV